MVAGRPKAQSIKIKSLADMRLAIQEELLVLPTTSAA